MVFGRDFGDNSGLTLRVGIFHLPPWSKLGNQSDGRWYLRGGILKYLLNHLTRATEFNFRLVTPFEHEHGAKGTNGSWSGVIGLLHTGKADLALAPFIPMAHRHEAVDFSSSFGFSFATILSGKSRTSETEMDFFNEIFAWKVFLLLLVIYVILAYLLVLEGWVTSSDTLWTSTWMEASDFFRQVVECVFRGGFASRLQAARGILWLSTGSILTCMWLLTITVVYCYVMASFKASLATIASSSIDSLQDLAKDPNIKPVVLRNSAFQDYFKYGHNAVQETVWKSIVRLGGAVSHRDFRSRKIVSEVLQGKSVLIANFINLRPLVSKYCPKKEKFYFSRSTFFSEPITLALRKHLDHRVRQVINEQLTQFAAMKHLSPHLRRSNFEAARCVVQPAFTAAVSLHITHLMEATYMFLGGLTVSFLTLFLEMFFKRCCMAVKKKRRRKIISPVSTIVTLSSDALPELT